MRNALLAYSEFTALNNQLTPYNRVLLEKLTVTEVAKKFPFMEPECSLPYSQDPATSPHPETDASSPHLPPYSPKIIITIVFSRIRPLGLFRFRIYFLKLINLLDSW
jgi:hypothetical protein